MERKELDYDIAYRAVKGDCEAQEKVLDYYDSYINALATIVEVKDNGNIVRYIDEELKSAIQEEYIKALPNCKAMK
jgi:hypothetical protein